MSRVNLHQLTMEVEGLDAGDAWRNCTGIRLEYDDRRELLHVLLEA